MAARPHPRPSAPPRPACRTGPAADRAGPSPSSAHRSAYSPMRSTAATRARRRPKGASVRMRPRVACAQVEAAALRRARGRARGAPSRRPSATRPERSSAGSSAPVCGSCGPADVTRTAGTVGLARLGDVVELLLELLLVRLVLVGSGVVGVCVGSLIRHARLLGSLGDLGLRRRRRVRAQLWCRGRRGCAGAGAGAAAGAGAGCRGAGAGSEPEPSCRRSARRSPGPAGRAREPRPGRPRAAAPRARVAPPESSVGHVRHRDQRGRARRRSGRSGAAARRRRRQRGSR